MFGAVKGRFNKFVLRFQRCVPRPEAVPVRHVVDRQSADIIAIIMSTVTRS
jgi:hypothetical protein